MKIAIVKVSSIGDIVHTSHIPQILKKYFPDCEIHWFCDETFIEILQNNIYIDKIHPVISKNLTKKKLSFLLQLFKLRHKFKDKIFDYVLDFQGTFKSALIAKAICRNENLWGYKETRDFVANKLYKKYCTAKLRMNVYYRAIEMIKQALQINATFNDIQIPLLGLSIQKLDILEKRDILIFPSSSKIEKNYGISHFVDVIHRFSNKKITLLYGSDVEFLLCTEIKTVCEGCDIKIIGDLGLSKVKTLISLHKCVIGVDTGILHMASALGVLNITLYGPTASYRTNIHKIHSVSLQGNGFTSDIPPKIIIQHLIDFNI